MGVVGLALAMIAATVSPTLAQDPLASNNGLYPGPAGPYIDSLDWGGGYLTANLSYPEVDGENAWPVKMTPGALNAKDAQAYAYRLKAHLADTLRPLIDTPQLWDPVAAEWYDMVWSGEGMQTATGIDPTSGREALMNTYSGQVFPAETFDPPYRPNGPVQNHAVIYYNSTAAVGLGNLWANLYAPRVSGSDGVFADGSIIIKVEAVTNTPEDWPVIKGSSTWNVFRPSTQDQVKGVSPLVPRVLTAHPIQIAVKVKDSIAAPQTGWVFAAFVYDRTSSGATPWDHFVPLGLQWGNDPAAQGTPSGTRSNGPLKETWVNSAAPPFTHGSLGWGGRLSGPMDVSNRHNVITTSGERYQGAEGLTASSCISCHSAAEFPRSANLYPSPNRSFPRDGTPFLMYDPGSKDWDRWFQNRPGTESLSSGPGVQALDYDMALMFAWSAFNEIGGNSRLQQELFHVH